MFEEYDENSSEGFHHHSSIESLRDHMLTMFGEYLSHVSKMPPNEVNLEHTRQFLNVQEVETIIKEMADIRSGEAYGIGANSFEEYREKMTKLFRALAARILSNIMHAGVQAGLLDSEYDFEKGEFDFSITEKGMAVAKKFEIPLNEKDSNAATKNQ